MNNRRKSGQFTPGGHTTTKQEIEDGNRKAQIEIMDWLESGKPLVYTRIAELMGEKYPERTTNAWRKVVAREYKKLDPTANGLSITDLKRRLQTMEEVMSENNIINPDALGDNDYITSEQTWYDEKNDTYFTFLRSANQTIKVPGDIHREMKSDYSNMTSRGLTINEIARKYNFPRNWFNEYRNRNGWTHDMDPYTDEEMAAAGSTDDLVDDLVLRKRRELHKKYEKKKWEEIVKSAELWDEFESNTLTVLRMAILESDKAVEKTPKAMKSAKNKDPYALVISPTDLHYGKYGWHDEVGDGYNMQEAEDRLMEKTQELINRLPYAPEKVIVATGSDWFHIDGHWAQTTKGTPQDIDGSPAQILINGCHLARKHIDLLRQIAPVEVYFMRGNHDKHTSLTLMLYLHAVYENIKDVDVNVDPKVRHYTTYGTSLIGFTHGDSTDHKKLPNIMAQERKHDWGTADFRLFFTGHKHHLSLKEDGGVVMIGLPSLSGGDRWHHQKGYIARPGLQAHVIDKEKGMITSLFATY